MTTAQIAEATGWTELQVQTVSHTASWDQLTVAQCRTFTKACGLDFTSPEDINRVECYLRKNQRRPSFKYLTSNPHWKTCYLPLIVQWRASLKQVPDELPEPIKRLLKGVSKS